MFVLLGGLNVLQLMNEPTAVALNYGMFRRKEINGTVRWEPDLYICLFCPPFVFYNGHEIRSSSHSSN